MAKAMTLKDRFERFLGMTKDADPAEAAELLVQMAADEMKSDEEAPPAAKDNETPKVDQETQVDEGALGPVLEAVKALTDKFDELSAKVDSMQAPATDNDPLAALEAELTKEIGDDESGEGEHTVPAESIDEEPTEDEEPTGDEDTTGDEESTTDEDGTEDEEPTADNEAAASTSDKRMVLAEIKRMRPIVAGMKDQKAKKAITDSLLRLGKAAKGASGNGRNGYKQLADARAAALRKQGKAKPHRDAEAESVDQQAKYDAFNPHLKKGV